MDNEHRNYIAFQRLPTFNLSYFHYHLTTRDLWCHIWSDPISTHHIHLTSTIKHGSKRILCLSKILAITNFNSTALFIQMSSIYLDRR